MPGHTEPAFRPVLKALTFGLSEHTVDATSHSKGPTSGPNLSRPRGPVSGDESHPPGGSGSRRPSWGTPSGTGGWPGRLEGAGYGRGRLGEGRLLRSVAQAERAGAPGRERGFPGETRAREQRAEAHSAFSWGRRVQTQTAAARPAPCCTPDPRSLLQLKMILIKCCDISNEVRPMEVAEPWVDCLLEEYFMQVGATPTLRTSGRPAWPFLGSVLEERQGVPRGTSGAGPRRLPQLPGSPRSRATPR